MVVSLMLSISATAFADMVAPSDSGWILSSQVPAGVKITAEKWTYDQKFYQESQNPSMSGWTLEGSYWKQSNSGSFNYAAFPSSSYYPTSDQYYKSYQKSAYGSYETSTAKRTVSTNANGYIFYHYAFPDAYSDGDNLIGEYYGEWGPAHTTQATIWESFYSTNSGTLSSHTDNSGTRAVYKFPGHSNRSYWWFRLNVYRCSYTDYVKTYKFYKTESRESSTSVNASSTITNVKHWVKVAGGAVDKFTDVPDNAWYASYVKDLAAEGILNGRTSTTFDPEGTITRAEFAKILATASGEDLSSYTGNSQFSDCNGHWAKKYINWAAAKGIVAGVGNGKFAPDEKITREALCTMVWRYSKYKGIYPEKVMDAISFGDDSSISAWAKEAVYIMQKAGVLNGRGNNCFDPKGNSKRSECAKVICVYQRCKNDTAAYNNMRAYRNKYSGSNYNFFLADLTHDGKDDLVVTYKKVPQNGSYRNSVLEVYTMDNGSVKKIYDKDIYCVGHQNTYWLMRDAKGSSLMIYHLDAATGQTEQSLEIFSLDSSGNKNYSYKSHVHFYMDGSPLDVGVPSKYYTDKNAYEQYSKKAELLIMSNDNGLTITSSSFYSVFGNLGN